MNYATDLDWHREFLAFLARRLRPTSYLELGCEATPAVLGLAEFCGVTYGVDVTPIGFEPPSNFRYFQMTTDDFFERSASAIESPELILIDACHRSDQVLRDFEGVKKIAATNALVVFHDTFPENIAYRTEAACWTSYLVPPEILASGEEIVTLPFPPGVSIVRLNPHLPNPPVL